MWRMCVAKMMPYMLDKLRSRYPVYMNVSKEQNSSTFTLGTCSGAGPAKSRIYVPGITNILNGREENDPNKTRFLITELHVVQDMSRLIKSFSSTRKHCVVYHNDR